jgi:DNA transformation protein
MASSAEYLSYVIGQLSMLHGVSARRMFGGFGLYCEDRFFGLISGDVLYFRVADGNRADYEARGMGQFRPFAGRPQVSMSYFEVPADVLEDVEECAQWARRSVAAATVPPRKRRAAR